MKTLLSSLAAGMLMSVTSVQSADFEIYQQHVPGATVRGRVVSVVCTYPPPGGYIACRRRPLQTEVEVGLIEVDGTVAKRQVFTNRAGRFSIRVAPNRYYLFAPLPPVLEMRTEPVEITVPPEGTTIELRVHELEY